MENWSVKRPTLLSRSYGIRIPGNIIMIGHAHSYKVFLFNIFHTLGYFGMSNKRCQRGGKRLPHLLF